MNSVLREWILKVREVKSEMKICFTLFEKWKVKWKLYSLFSRSEKWNENLIHSFREVKSEMKMPRDREVKFLENSWEFKISWKFSRNSPKPKKKKVFKSRPSFFPPLAFECIVVLPLLHFIVFYIKIRQKYSQLHFDFTLFFSRKKSEIVHEMCKNWVMYNT